MNNSDKLQVILFILGAIIIPSVTAGLLGLIHNIKNRKIKIKAYRMAWHGSDAIAILNIGADNYEIRKITTDEGTELKRFYAEWQDPAEPKQGHLPERLRFLRINETKYNLELSRTAKKILITGNKVNSKKKQKIELDLNIWEYNN